MPQAVLAVLVGLAVCQISIVLTTVYLHRTLAHRSIQIAPGLALVFRFIIWVSTGIQPREWAAVHRRHHAFTDVEGDPHSPVLLGFWKVQLTNAILYRRCARDGVTVERYAKDLQPDKWDKYIFSHPYVGLGVGIAILCVSLGWQWGLLASAVHVLTYLALNAGVNAFGHVRGKKTYDNTAFNIQWLAFLTAGEGLHNNHHAAPTAANLSHRRSELDPGWWLIRFFEKLHWAKVRLDSPKFVNRVPASLP